jgi:NAD(P)-dependent dehydrogenase (short-subunit alcohol dehydrogenase family)
VSIGSVSYDFTGAVVVVTGAARGLGRDIALGFAAAGASVAISDVPAPNPALGYDTATSTDLGTVAGEIGERALAVEADVRSEADVEALFARALARFGRIDVLVNNAGVFVGNTPVTETTEAQWDAAVDVNLKGPFLCTKHAARHMIDRGGGGRVITIASTSALVGIPYQVPYQSSKTGIIGQVRTLGVELAKHGITVNCICPTVTHTPMLEFLAREESVYYLEELKQLAGLFTIFPGVDAMEPRDVTAMVLWVASDAARYVTGAALPLDAGYTIK